MASRHDAFVQNDANYPSRGSIFVRTLQQSECAEVLTTHDVIWQPPLETKVGSLTELLELVGVWWQLHWDLPERE